MCTGLGMFDVQEVSSNAGLCRALLAHAIHQVLHEAVEFLCHSGSIAHILQHPDIVSICALMYAGAHALTGACARRLGEERLQVMHEHYRLACINRDPVQSHWEHHDDCLIGVTYRSCVKSEEPRETSAPYARTGTFWWGQ